MNINFKNGEMFRSNYSHSTLKNRLGLNFWCSMPKIFTDKIKSKAKFRRSTIIYLIISRISYPISDYKRL